MVGLGDLFGGSDNHAKQLAIQKEISKKIDIINTSIDKLKDKLGKSYGMEAVKTKQELDKVVASNQSKYAQGVLEAGWDNYGGGHSDWYHWNKNAKNIAKDIARTYGLGDVWGWEDLFSKLGNMENGGGAKILDKIRTEHGLDWWHMMGKSESGSPSGRTARRPSKKLRNGLKSVLLGQHSMMSSGGC